MVGGNGSFPFRRTADERDPRVIEALEREKELKRRREQQGTALTGGFGNGQRQVNAFQTALTANERR